MRSTVVLPAGKQQGQVAARSAAAAAQRSSIAPPSDGPRIRPDRFGELEAYRGVAALLIVVFHAYQYSREALGRPRYVYEGTPWHHVFNNLDGGVAWFFVLSGFLVFLPFARAAVEQRSALSIGSYLSRRAFRILPPYYLAIVLVWTWRYTGSPGERTDLIEHLTFTHIFDVRHIFWTIGPAWSLAVEVIFYLFLAGFGPLACWLCGRWGTPPARAAALAGGITVLLVASVAYKWWAATVARVSTQDWPVYFGPMAKLDTFALGMLLAVAAAVLGNRLLLAGPASAALRLLGILMLVACFILRSPGSLIDVYFDTLSGLAFALVLASTILGPRGSAWERALARPAPRFLGLISYSIYLWHEPLMEELGKRNLLIHQAPTAFPANALLLLLLSVAVATVSYWLVERPSRHLSNLFTKAGRLVRRFR